MAWVYDYAVTELTTAGTAFTADMPEHQADDMLIVFASKDTTGALTQTNGTYTALSSGAGGAQWVGAWYKRATTSADGAPTFTLTSDEANCVVVCVRGAHTSTAPTSVIATDDTTMSGGGYLQDATYVSPSTNSLILFGGGTDSGQAITPMPGFGQVLYAGDAGTAGVGVWWQFFKSSGVDVDNYQCFGNVADNCRIITVGVPDDGNNTYEPGRVDLTSTDQIIYGGKFTGATLVAPDTTWTAAGSNSITMLGTDWDKVWTASGAGPAWTDETTNLNDDGAGDVPLGNTVTNAVYFGSATTFNSFCVDVGTAGTGAPAVVWEYSQGGGTWATLAFNTYIGVAAWNSNFTTAGAGVIRFPIPSAWAKDTVNGEGSPGYYYIRQRVTTVWTAAPTLDQSLKNGRPLSYDASAAVGDSGVNPYSNSLGITPTTSSATPAVVLGGEYVSTATNNWSTSTGYLLTSVNFTQARDIVDIGFYDLHKGLTFTLMDANAENRRTSWLISAKDATDASGDKRSIIGIQPAQATDTAIWRHGNLNETAIDTVLAAAASPFGDLSASCSMLMLVGEHILAGGTTTLPLTFTQFINALKHGTQEFPVLDPQGNLADVWYPIKFGGGDDLHVSCNLNIFQFPTRASSTNQTTRWHVDDNLVGFDFNGQSGDTIHFSNCLFTGGTPYYWRLNASANSGCDWNFAGCTLVGATVTLRSVYTFSTMIFIDCSEITTNGATVQDCTIRDTRATTAQGAIAFVSATEGNAVDRITFIDNNDGDIGHSIRITATGTYTFDEHTFSGGGPAARSFNTSASGVDDGNDYITTDAVHGYTDGDAVYYQDQGGTQVVGSLVDGTMYYVNAIDTDTLSFHTTKAEAIAGTPKVALAPAGSETHYLYSAKADVFNNSGGAVTIEVINSGDIPTIRNSNGSSTTVNTTVTLEINGVIQNAQCYIVPVAGGSALMNEAAATIVSGNEYKATENYNYTGSTAVAIRAREMGYLPFETSGTITNAGLTITAVWQVDPNWKLVVSGENIQFTNPATITRTNATFISEGWLDVMGQVTVDGSVSNDGTYTISVVAASTLTITGATLTNEGPSAGITLTFTRRSLT